MKSNQTCIYISYQVPEYRIMSNDIYKLPLEQESYGYKKMGVSTKKYHFYKKKYLVDALSIIARWRRRSLMTRILSRCPRSLRPCHILQIRDNLLCNWNCHAICHNVVGCPASLMQNLLLKRVSLCSHRHDLMIALYSQLSQLTISLSPNLHKLMIWLNPHLCKLPISLHQLSLSHYQL